MLKRLNDEIDLLRSLLLIPLENPVHLLGSQVLVKVVIHLRRGSPAARSNAFHFFQAEHTVGCGLFMSDAQFFGALMKDLLAAANHATYIRADLHVVLATRLGV